MKTLTVDYLYADDACFGEIALFERVFPNGAALSLKNLQKAKAAGLSVDWLERTLSAPARAEYERVSAPARAEYERVSAAALLTQLRLIS